MGVTKTPIRPAGAFLVDSGSDRNYHLKLLIGTPTRGRVSIEWHLAMLNRVIPPNWGSGMFTALIDECYPKRFTVAHAQNVIVKHFMEHPVGYEHLLLIEDDTIPPPDIYLKLDKYLRDGPPIVSGLYYQKGHPPEPLIYRGRGNGAFTDWKPGQAVWCDGVACGCLLIHRSIIEVLYNDSREYTTHGQTLREVFLDPRRVLVDENGMLQYGSGTSDLEFCRRVIQEDVLKRAGWSKIARKRWPFLVDTAIRCGHIDAAGTIY